MLRVRITREQRDHVELNAEPGDLDRARGDRPSDRIPRRAGTRCFLRAERENYALAFTEIDAALKLDPRYIPAWFRLGQAAAVSGTNLARGDARAAYANALKIDPKWKALQEAAERVK
jgi:tetratricopeptide (TPR) repeat protein